ncbi:MAG: hypothetical protein EA427_04315 [Spirochaetaceae bacterium]|nr:MAG: hypothetical protein EA427_04315 [Spirochaetaceae bacterium]
MQIPPLYMGMEQSIFSVIRWCRVHGAPMLIGLLASGVLVSGLLAGCELPGITLTVAVPDLPEQYQVHTWDVRWWDGNSVREERREGLSAGDAAPFILPLDSGGVVLPVVVLVPVAGPGPGQPLAPYGGWLPPGESSIVPDRHGGELGEVLLAVARAGIDPSLVNVARLDDLIRARVPRNPRRLDRDRLVTALAGQAMRSHHVAERWATLHQVRLPRGADTVAWIGDDPREEPYLPAPAGAYELFSVPVMDGEVRRLWRPCSGELCHQVLIVHRTPAGNAYHTVVEVPLSDLSSLQN